MILDVNRTLDQAPETVNRSPYDDGWMLKVKLTDPAAVNGLLDAAAYTASIG